MRETVEEDESLTSVRELRKLEGYELLNRQTMTILGISAAEFLTRHDARCTFEHVEHNDLIDLEMLIPFAR